MKEKLVEQLGKELKLAIPLDLVTMLIAVGITMAFFALAGICAGSSVGSMPDLSGGIMGGLKRDMTFNVTPTIIMFVALIAIAVVNWYGIKVLRKNKAERAKASEGLIKLFTEEGVGQYSDGTILKSYETRYSLYTIIMGSVAAVSIIATLAIFIDQLTKL